MVGWKARHYHRDRQKILLFQCLHTVLLSQPLHHYEVLYSNLLHDRNADAIAIRIVNLKRMRCQLFFFVSSSVNRGMYVAVFFLNVLKNMKRNRFCVCIDFFKIIYFKKN